MNYLMIVVGFTMLILGGNWLLKAAVSMSLRINVPKIVIGMTVVSFATSAPELIVSLNAALEGHADISLGNVIGSNIANLGFVLSIVLIVSTIEVENSFYKTDWPIMMLSSVLLYVFLTLDGKIVRWEGILMFSLLIAFLIFLFKFQGTAVVEEDIGEEELLSIGLTIGFFVLGGIGLWGGSELLIKGAVNLANDFGVSKRIIGITIISIGTSIPELAASLIAIINKEKAISLGNLLGSNVFNILAVLGITSMITPIVAMDQGLIETDLIWMLIFALVIFPLVFIPVRMKLTWKEGLILLGGYISFVAILI